MNKKIYTIAVGFIVSALLLSILWPYEAKLVDWEAPPTYAVLESDEIYFNNTRIVYYRTEESKELTQQGFKTHRATKAFKDTAQPLMNATIINHWRNDLAYVVFEPNLRSYFEEPILLQIGDTAITLDINHMNFEDHYELAATLFERSLSYQRPYLIQGKDSLLLYGTQANEKVNQVVLKDYFRLVGKYQ